MKRQPRHPALPNLLGIAQSSSGDVRASVASFQKALKLDPGFDDARKNMAQSLVLLGQFEKAETILSDLTRRHPNDAGALYQLAQLRSKTGDLTGARNAADAAISADPGMAPAYNLRALVREKLEGPAAALQDYTTAVSLNPNDVNALVNMSLSLSRVGRHADGLARVQKAVDSHPSNIGARSRLALMQMELGHNDEAAANLQTVLNADPLNTNALVTLAKLLPAGEGEALVPPIQKSMRRSNCGAHDKGLLTFALADIARKRKDRASEVKWMTEANAAMAKISSFDSARDDAEHDAIAARFPTPESIALGSDDGHPQPIFVMGLPRSGTSLTETLLSAHDAVEGLGELASAGILLQRTLRAQSSFDAEDADAFARAYREALPALPDSTRAFVDKMPDNYKLVGFLKSAFPQARFVHLRRDPRAIALSVWRTSFSGSALAYGYDLIALADHANAYASLMQHWRNLLGADLYDLDYAVLANDVTGATKDLARYCGLDWHPAMTRPDQSSAAVSTASATQIREPVHARSVAQWQAYADLLDPFTNRLDKALWKDLLLPT